MSAVSMLKDPFTVDPDKWTPLHMKLIKRAASYPEVDRSSCILRSKRYCARRRVEIAPGSPRCGHGGTTTIISMCASPVRREPKVAKLRSRSAATTGAAKNLRIGTMLKKAAIALNAPAAETKPFTGKTQASNGRSAPRMRNSAYVRRLRAPCQRRQLASGSAQCSRQQRVPALRRPRSIRLRDKPWPEAVLLGRCLCHCNPVR